MGLGLSLRRLLICLFILSLSTGARAGTCADTALIAGQAVTASMGDIVSYYDKEFETRIYYGLSEPRRDGTIPLVSDKARAIEATL